eukprot:262400_1
MSVAVSIICTLISYILVADGFMIGDSTQYIIPTTLAPFRSDDRSQLTTPLYVGSRVMDLMNGEHFDNVLQDTPDHMRPPAIVLFHDPMMTECKSKYDSMDYIDAVTYQLPSRAFLFATRYDIRAAPQRTWYKFTPERDLAKRFGITQCPSLVWVPSKCSGWTDWCVRETVGGVE